MSQDKDLCFGGRKFLAWVTSDDRDGLIVELRDADHELAFQIFYSDRTGEMTCTAFAADLPLDAVEYLIGMAKLRLPPQLRRGLPSWT